VSPISRFSTPAAEVYAQIMKAAGNVPNTFATVGAHGPATLQADGVLAASTLSKQDQETVKLLISEVAGCDYCVGAHSMLGKMMGLAPEVRRPTGGRGQERHETMNSLILGFGHFEG
jgi:AhpD family alkylhydroperoxidase